MNDFNEKPIDTKVRETALRIMERAMFYNNTQTKQSITGGKPTFFVQFSGHIATMEVDIHRSGWGQPNDDPECFTIPLTERGYNGTYDEIQNKLVSVLKRMEEVYTDWYEKEYTNE